MDKISENEERKIEDRLLAIEAAINSILKTLERYNDIISKLQTFLFLQSGEDSEIMDLYLRLFMSETGQPVNCGVNHGKM